MHGFDKARKPRCIDEIKEGKIDGADPLHDECIVNRDNINIVHALLLEVLVRGDISRNLIAARRSERTGNEHLHTTAYMHRQFRNARISLDNTHENVPPGEVERRLRSRALLLDRNRNRNLVPRLGLSLREQRSGRRVGSFGGRGDDGGHCSKCGWDE